MTLTILSVIYVLFVFGLFYLIRRKFRITLLALASLGYVCLLDSYAGIAVIIVAFFTWIVALFFMQAKTDGRELVSKLITAVGIILIVVLMLFMKLCIRIPSIVPEDTFLHRFILPIGFSFYSFQAIGYLVDVYKGIIPVEKNFFRLLFYLIWFPKFVSGPIERKQDMDEQLAGINDLLLFDAARWSHVIQYVLIGAFYKIVIADRLGIYVDMIYDAYETVNSFALFVGMVLYSFQIYFDFAGYSYAAIGFSLIFGIRLTENFRLPYMSENITDFWRRWHCSLSAWLKDYVYIPLGGGYKGQARKIFNTMMVFLVCGIWHGESLNFIAWGLIHGVYSAIDGMPFLREGKGRFLRHGWIGRLLTFMGVSFAWVFFRSISFKDSIKYLIRMFTAGITRTEIAYDWELIFLDHIGDIYIIVITIMLVLIAEYVAYRSKLNLPQLLIGRPYYIQYTAVFLMMIGIMILGVYGPSHDTSRMIYMQF